LKSSSLCHNLSRKYRRAAGVKNKLALIALATMVLIVFPSFAPMVHATEPWNPNTANVFYEGTIGWGPVNADPATCYDVLSGELVFNSYENLIAWSGEQYGVFTPVLATNNPARLDIVRTVANTSSVGPSDPTGSTWSDGSTSYTCVGFVDENVTGTFNQGDVIYLSDGSSWRTWTVDAKTGTSNITLNLWRGSYAFNIRTSPTIYFYNESGVAVDTFDIADAQYSLQRALVQDQFGSAIWMFDKAFFDKPDHTYWTNPTAMNLAHLIDNAIEADTIANTLTINVGIRFPDTSFKQILANTWGAIGSKEFSTSIHCWDGNLYNTTKYGGPFPDWWIDWNNIELSPYDINWRYCGTGPYHVAVVDSVNSKVILQKNPGYRGGWPAQGCNGSLDTVEIDYISNWVSRRDLFIGGWLDSCTVPRAYMFQLLDNTTKEPLDPGIKTIKGITPTLSMDAEMFNFVISDSSPYIGSGHLPDGIPTNFFNNTHVRKAFAYAFNATQYGEQVFSGESEYRKNFLISGLVPDYYNDSVPGYSESLANAETELEAAFFDQRSVWYRGFTVDLIYNVGDDNRMVACYMLRSFFQTLSTYNGRSGPAFTVNMMGISWSAFVSAYLTRTLPMWDIGLSADFADADNFARRYMYSTRAFADFQGYTASNGWGNMKDHLVDQAFLTADGSARQALYNQLAQIYYDDCPSFPVNIPQGRFWCWYWVKGWYYDALYPSTYYYTIWKMDDCWCDVSGSTVGISDGVTNMKDIAYLYAHFNAKAPVPGFPPDPKWVSVYGANGCVDPYGDRVCNMKDIAMCIQHFNHHMNSSTP